MRKEKIFSLLKGFRNYQIAKRIHHMPLSKTPKHHSFNFLLFPIDLEDYQEYWYKSSQEEIIQFSVISTSKDKSIGNIP